MKRSLFILLLAAAGVRIGLASVLPLTDPTEGRYAQIAREMVVSGDWVTPRLWINGEHVPFLGKPPLFFWTAASSITIFGTNEFAVRLPSFVAGAALLILMYGVLSRYIGQRTAISATLMTATSAIFFFLSGSVALDLLFALFVAGALLIFLAFALEVDPRIQGRWSLVFFVFLAGGFLTKGPVVLVLIGLPVVIWTGLRSKLSLVGRHSWTLGVALFITIVTPWFVLIELKNPGFLRYFFINENLLRYVSQDYGDIYGTSNELPRGSAVLLFVLAALPWSIVATRQIFKSRWHGFREMMRDDVQSF